ncbi:PTS mannose transporter subunit IIB [Vagococcus sp. BWB3-3]|uniref:PTS mannose transporter subunit IIB n=1 Tax=Vagococcus allomyrinae TaxID=2794353 RepID=A0A940SXZ7_9ENTE|nr:PTS mannose transporter subunit IIB [Vagococcus allomyrinae]MBP1042883.1 PTS mannose transporter subunit IIB [Vagococcus allomyrinae]
MTHKLILASHGSLAEGMVSAIDMILGTNHDVQGFGLDTYETPDEIGAKVQSILAEDPRMTYILITDIKGGSVYNELVKFCVEENVYVLTGMNLSMCLELQLMSAEINVAEKLDNVLQTSRQGIDVFSKVIISEKKQLEDEELW